MDSDIAEKTLSKTSRKQRRCDTGPSNIPTGEMTEFPDAEPMEVGLHTVLPPVGSAQQAPETMVSTATVMPSSTLAPLLWEKGDPPASIMGKWPCLLGKTKTGL